MQGVRLSEEELDSLFGEPPEWFVLYIYIRRFMDYKTGISGLVKRFSEQAFKENAFYINKKGGRHTQKPVTREKIRSTLRGLISNGLLVPKSECGELVFFHPKALLEESVQNSSNQRTTKGATNDDSDKALNKEENNEDIFEQQPRKKIGTTHIRSQNNINNKKHYLYKYAHFDEFWENYPRKEGGRTAMREWWGQKGFDEFGEIIIADVKLRKEKHVGWLGKKKFIPYPKSYLNKRLWEDEIIEEQADGKSNGYRHKSATERNAEMWDYLREAAGYTSSSESSEQVYSGTVYEDDGNLRLPLEQPNDG